MRFLLSVVLGGIGLAVLGAQISEIGLFRMVMGTLLLQGAGAIAVFNNQ